MVSSVLSCPASHSRREQKLPGSWSRLSLWSSVPGQVGRGPHHGSLWCPWHGPQCPVDRSLQSFPSRLLLVVWILASLGQGQASSFLVSCPMALGQSSKSIQEIKNMCPPLLPLGALPCTHSPCPETGCRPHPFLSLQCPRRSSQSPRPVGSTFDTPRVCHFSPPARPPARSQLSPSPGLLSSQATCSAQLERFPKV